MNAPSLRSTRRLSLALAAGAALLLCTTEASAQVGRHSRGHARRGAIARQLGITETQRDQMRAAAHEHRSQIEETRDTLRAAGRALKTALAAQPRDAATVDAARAAVHQAQEAAKAAREARRADVGAALTPEQREELKTLKEARRACRKP